MKQVKPYCGICTCGKSFHLPPMPPWLLWIAQAVAEQTWWRVHDRHYGRFDHIHR